MTQLKWFSPLAFGRRAFRLLQHGSTHTFTFLLAVGFSLSLGLAACNASNPANNLASNSASNEIAIGFQKSGTLAFVKAQASLEKRLKPNGGAVKWVEFSSGPPLEALNAGSIDFGHAGDAPPILAQAAGIPLLYVANTPPSPEGSAILVRNDSPIQRVADLKGKQVAFAKGSSSHNFIVQALAADGLQYSDIKPAFLAPAEARAAFERGSIDAWAIWDPFYAAAQTATKARVLVDGKNLVSGREFYLASRTFTEKHPDLVQLVVEAVNQAGEWARENPREVAEFLAPELGIDLPSLEQSERRRRRYGVQPMTMEAIAEQQKVADTFFDLRLIPQPINVKEIVWTPKSA